MLLTRTTTSSSVIRRGGPVLLLLLLLLLTHPTPVASKKDIHCWFWSGNKKEKSDCTAFHKLMLAVTDNGKKSYAEMDANTTGLWRVLRDITTFCNVKPLELELDMCFKHVDAETREENKGCSCSKYFRDNKQPLNSCGTAQSNGAFFCSCDDEDFCNGAVRASRMVWIWMGAAAVLIGRRLA